MDSCVAFILGYLAGCLSFAVCYCISYKVIKAIIDSNSEKPNK